MQLVDMSLAHSLDKIQNIVSGAAPAENDKVCGLSAFRAKLMFPYS
jgi:hypothetical protein